MYLFHLGDLHAMCVVSNLIILVHISCALYGPGEELYPVILRPLCLSEMNRTPKRDFE
jgi:hypothetical protein